MGMAATFSFLKWIFTLYQRSIFKAISRKVSPSKMSLLYTHEVSTSEVSAILLGSGATENGFTAVAVLSAEVLLQFFTYTSFSCGCSNNLGEAGSFLFVTSIRPWMSVASMEDSLG